MFINGCIDELGETTIVALRSYWNKVNKIPWDVISIVLYLPQKMEKLTLYVLNFSEGT